MLRTTLTAWHYVPTTCTRAVAVHSVPKRNINHSHNNSSGDLTKFIPNVAHVDKNPSNALQVYKKQSTDRYKDLLTEYSTNGMKRFAELKKKGAKLANRKEETENPQFVLQNRIFNEIVTDLTKYDLDTVDPYLMMLESTSHEERVEAQRVISAVMKKEISRNHVEKAFDYFRLLQISYLPVDSDVYALLRGKIKEAFMDLLSNRTKVPAISTLNTIMDYFAETDRVGEAFTLILSMKTAGIIPNEHTYQALLHACMRYEDTDDAMVAFDLMKEDDIVLDYSYYDRLFQLCASSVYPLGAQTVLEEMCNRFNIPKEQRWIHTLTLYITQFMKFAKMEQSFRGKRGWVTAVSIQTKLVFPPKTKNNMLLEPELGDAKEGLFQALSDCKYGLHNDTQAGVKLPPLRELLESFEKEGVKQEVV